MPDERFISESLEPRYGVGPGIPVRAGEPVLPGSFRWRGDEYPVLRLLESGRALGPCTHGSGERYVRRHWYRIETTGGLVMRIYFERRPAGRARSKQRWWLYALAIRKDAPRNEAALPGGVQGGGPP